MVTDSQNILIRWSKHFSQLLSDNDVRQTEIHTSESLLSEPRALEFEMAIGKLNRNISPGNVQIPEKLIKAVGRIIRSEIHDLINASW